MGKEDVARPCPNVVDGRDETISGGTKAVKRVLESGVDEDRGEDADVVSVRGQALVWFSTSGWRDLPPDERAEGEKQAKRVQAPRGFGETRDSP